MKAGPPLRVQIFCFMHPKDETRKTSVQYMRLQNRSLRERLRDQAFLEWNCEEAGRAAPISNSPSSPAALTDIASQKQQVFHAYDCLLEDSLD